MSTPHLLLYGERHHLALLTAGNQQPFHQSTADFRYVFTGGLFLLRLFFGGLAMIAWLSVVWSYCSRLGQD